MMEMYDGICIREAAQARLKSSGPESLSDLELLSILFRGCDAGQISREILGNGGLKALLKMDFSQLPGVGKSKAFEVESMVEIAKRIHYGSEASPLMDSPERIYAWLRPECVGIDVEKFWVLSLDRKNRLIGMKAVTSGTATAALVHPREVFREAIRNGAAACVCAHNHPSGDPSPSQADIRATRQLREAGNTVQIQLMDHVVVGEKQHDPHGNGYYSFAEAGLL